MAKYRVKKSFIGKSTVLHGGKVVLWANDTSQDMLEDIYKNHHYGQEFVELDSKTNKKDEETINKKDDSSKKDSKK